MFYEEGKQFYKEPALMSEIEAKVAVAYWRGKYEGRKESPSDTLYLFAQKLDRLTEQIEEMKK